MRSTILPVHHITVPVYGPPGFEGMTLAGASEVKVDYHFFESLPAVPSFANAPGIPAEAAYVEIVGVTSVLPMTFADKLGMRLMIAPGDNVSMLFSRSDYDAMAARLIEINEGIPA